jgi:very-short-patch-repair endonuclease
LPEADALLAALHGRDAARYAQTYEELVVAHAELGRQARCHSLAMTLHGGHPTLAESLVNSAADDAWPARLAELDEAWAWARAAAFCARDYAPDADQKLAGELATVESRLLTVTGELAAVMGWKHCLGRMNREQRLALQAYKSHLAHVGKGTGRYAARDRAAARDAMEVASSAVPAWVMPLAQVIETIPARPDSFDVVIVDEASQAGLEALFLLWLAPKVVVVGDDKQCAPGAMGLGEFQKHFDRRDAALPDMQRWLREGLRPNASLYELLSARFADTIRLSEHFRCMPEIIGWSSDQFYDKRLVPLRQFGSDRLEPLRTVRVEGAYTEGNGPGIRNPIEAKELVETLQRLLEDPAYASRSFGVVTLQGRGQAALIENLIVESVDPAVAERHNIRVGTPADFQGDERDVMLLSMVTVNAPKALTGVDDQRRFNVAASRAKDQMWLFHSPPLEQLKSADLRRSLLSYMANPPDRYRIAVAEDPGAISPDVLKPPFESLFEQRVYLRIRERGYRVVPQFPVEGRRIDLVVIGAGSRLAVECDGRAWHTSPEQRVRDLDREHELVRAGWQFWRVRDSEFHFDPDRALQTLWTTLERRGITPVTGHAGRRRRRRCPGRRLRRAGLTEH